jgi:hypothetical protein
MTLLLSVLSPITEMFPSLNLSWWPFKDEMGVITPAYQYMRSMRVVAVLVVWIPIILKLSTILPKFTTGLITLLFSVSFSLRAIDFKEGRAGDESGLPGILYMLGMLLIYFNTSIAAPIAGIMSGGILISYTRNKRTWIPYLLDWTGRLVFSASFLRFLYELQVYGRA